jgi:ATP-binding cassette subfamily B protein
MAFPFYRQHDAMDCGPACLKMICEFHGRKFSMTRLREAAHITRQGVSMLGISDAAEAVGIKTMGVRITFGELVEASAFPCIAHWQQNHFVVVTEIKKSRRGYRIRVADPAHGMIWFNQNDFINAWQQGQDDDSKGICLLLEPMPEFFAMIEDPAERQLKKFIIRFLRPYRAGMGWLVMAMVLASCLQFAFPWLTRQIVDKGIARHDLGFITLVLLGQMALFLGLISIEFFRSRMLVYISNRISISMVSEFLQKLLRLPLSFFGSKQPGDIIQRITDHQRIQSFITNGLINVVFSSMTMLVFGIVLAIYSPLVLAVLLASSLFYSAWVYFFMKKRKELDYIRFSKLSENQDTLLQIINGISEIKLTNSEKSKSREWEKIQEKLFDIQIKGLKISQYQDLGSFFFLRTRDIIITFITAWLVINGQITLGTMLAIQFILGQLNGPIEQFVSFIRELQDAGISMERIQEVNNVADEEKEGLKTLVNHKIQRSISLENISFQYEGPSSPRVLEDVTFEIPAGKITAIVGMSGSGKTTLIKLLLSFYLPTRGKIFADGIPLSDFSNRNWRSICGCVMQDGYIFSDSIASNISLGDPAPSRQAIMDAIRISNLDEFIGTLPAGLQTRIGQDGMGLSQGQKQRILIARAVYRKPEILFFDEATNALDASNEKTIMNNLREFYAGRTVVVVAHRLSTVRDADQIIVLSKGRIEEKGRHNDLINNRGIYYRLVSNQLELAQ